MTGHAGRTAGAIVLAAGLFARSRSRSSYSGVMERRIWRSVPLDPSVARRQGRGDAPHRR